MGEVHISGFFQVGTVFRDVAPERTWTNHSESWRKVPHTLGTHADNETLCKTEGHPVIGYYDSDVFCRKHRRHRASKQDVSHRAVPYWRHTRRHCV